MSLILKKKIFNLNIIDLDSGAERNNLNTSDHQQFRITLEPALSKII